MRRTVRARWLSVLPFVAALTVATPAAASPAPTQAITVGTIVGGKAIFGGYERCTAGFNARTASGKKVIISAGHCGNRSWKTSNSNYFGSTARLVKSADGGDFQTIDFYYPKQWNTPGRVLYSGQKIPVRGTLSPGNGARVCWRGGMSGKTRCGTLYDVGGDSSVSGVVYHNTFKIHGCAVKGDSGAPIYVTHTDDQTHELVAFAVGILQGVTGCSGSGNAVVGQPIRKVLKRWNLKLVTG